MIDLFTATDTSLINLLAKGFVLVCIAGYGIYTFILYNHIRSLNRLLIIKHLNLSMILQLFSFIYLLLVLSLFVVAVVIL